VWSGLDQSLIDDAVDQWLIGVFHDADFSHWNRHRRIPHNTFAGLPACVCAFWTLLILSECSTSLLWQSIVVLVTELQGTSPTTVCQSPKFLVANICDLPDVINCQFHVFAVAPLGLVHFSLPDWQSGIHCLIICGIRLSTPNNLGGTWTGHS